MEVVVIDYVSAVVASQPSDEASQPSSQSGIWRGRCYSRISNKKFLRFVFFIMFLGFLFTALICSKQNKVTCKDVTIPGSIFSAIVLLIVWIGTSRRALLHNII